MAQMSFFVCLFVFCFFKPVGGEEYMLWKLDGFFPVPPKSFKVGPWAEWT